jgi:hypothetical protein
MYFLCIHEYGTLKMFEVIVKKENNGGDKTKQSMVYVYVEMPQQNYLYNYHNLIIMLK